jgi:formylglycine-generating enzyme required for sulfatase activity
MNPPTKPTDTRFRVNRGGSWFNDAPSWVRAASRDTDVPAFRDSLLGFRTSLTVRQPR